MLSEYIEPNEFGFDESKPTMIEEMLNWVQDGVVRVRYKPTLEKKYKVIEVTKYAEKDLSDQIGKNLGLFTKEDGKIVAIGSWQIKWFEFLGK